MLKTALFTILSASTLTHGATDAFDTLKNSAIDVVNVYAAAGQTLDASYSGSDAIMRAENNMYASAIKLEPLADYVLKKDPFKL